MNASIDLAGWTLLHFLWQGTLAGALAFAGLRVLRSAEARYAFACSALAAMVAAPVVTAWTISRAPSTTSAALVSMTASAPSPTLTAVAPARPATSPDGQSASPLTAVLPSIALDEVPHGRIVIEVTVDRTRWR